VKPDDILVAIQELTQREHIEFSPAASDPRPLSAYQPIEKYLLDLKNGSKPESAAEDLFTALCKDVLGFQPTRQVGVMEGYVDFMLPERLGEPLPLELKPLFQRDGPDALWRADANPKNHVAQVKNIFAITNIWFSPTCAPPGCIALGISFLRTNLSPNCRSLNSSKAAAKPTACSTPCAARKTRRRNRSWNSSFLKT
jgi:hypothetical protein